AVRLVTFLEKISMNFADHVITINEPIQDLLVSRGLLREKSTVIMNTVDEARFAGVETGNPSAHPDLGEKFVMLYHGTLTNIYGLDIAVEAFARVHREMPGAEIWILGSGPEKDELTRLAQERGVASKVKLLGQVASTEIPAWLSQCD